MDSNQFRNSATMLDAAYVLPDGIRRYSRLEICATWFAKSRSRARAHKAVEALGGWGDACVVGAGAVPYRFPIPGG
jgi:hypothetical protein